MADVLIWDSTERSPELRHELPIGIGDPFLYVEREGVRHVVIGSLEIPRVQELDGLEIHPPEEFGYDELVRSGLGRDAALLEIAARACVALGVERAVVPATFPLVVADRLRVEGIELEPQHELFNLRRRAKTPAELAGIRRAQAAADAGMAAAAGLLRGGGPVTSEEVKAAIDAEFMARGCSCDEFIVSHGAQAAIGHHMGEGTIAPGEPVVIDIWPRDRESACFADMTRTFVIGEPSDELVEWHRLVKAALDRSLELIRPGVRGREVYDAACEVFEAAGYPTQRTKEPGTALDHGFFHGLGHGVGLEVHEAPGMGLAGSDVVQAGDVVTVEPGLYRPGTGGCRLEDLVLVTDDGYENLTRFPYGLRP
ncbi:MAG: M24 family metallopeptidase [Gaiellaceae bacterium]